MKISKARLQQIIKEELKRALTESFDKDLNEYDEDPYSDDAMEWGDDMRDARRSRDVGAFDDYDEFEEDPEGYLYGENDLNEEDSDERNYTDDELWKMATGFSPVKPGGPGDKPMTKADREYYNQQRSGNSDESSALPGDWRDTQRDMGPGRGRAPRREPRRGNRPAYNAPGY